MTEKGHCSLAMTKGLVLLSLRDTALAVAWQSIDSGFKQIAQDSRIVDEKSRLCESTQGRALGVRNRRGDEAIRDLSLQAESTSQVSTPKHTLHSLYPRLYIAYLIIT